MAIKKICDGCKKETENTTEIKVGNKKFDACLLCKNRILEFFSKPRGFDFAKMFR